MKFSNYENSGLFPFDAEAMGAGVITGAGVFALTGQIAELAGP